MNNRTRWMVFILLILALTLSGCNANVPVVPSTAVLATATTLPQQSAASSTPLPPTATTAATATLAPTATTGPTATLTPPKDYGPDNFPTNVNPLTGLVVSDPNLLNRRPVAVKIQIVPRGQRPPWGVSLADIVWDYYQNNGSTRFNAVFYGTDAEKAGPIRSGRLLDISIVQMYKSIFAFGSADQRILNRIYNSDIANRLIFEGSHNCPPMCREDPNGFNFLVGNTAELTKYAVAEGINNDRQNLDGMTFQVATPANGEAAKQVFTRFNFSDYNRWDYDAATGRYLRFQDTQNDENGAGEAYAPLVDKLNNQQVSAANVVVLYVPHEFVVKSSSGGEIVNILLNGTGTAYAFRDGQGYALKWNRPTSSSVIYLTFPDGSRYPYKPGNTWYEVFGQSSQVSKPEGVWRFSFSIP